MVVVTMHVVGFGFRTDRWRLLFNCICWRESCWDTLECVNLLLLACTGQFLVTYERWAGTCSGIAKMFISLGSVEFLAQVRAVLLGDSRVPEPEEQAFTCV